MCNINYKYIYYANFPVPIILNLLFTLHYIIVYNNYLN